MCLRRWKADRFEDSIDASLNLPIEAVRIQVVNDRELGVAHPRVDQSSVKSDCLVDALIASLIVGIRVKLCCAVRRSDHMDHSFVAAITKLDRAPMGLIK